MEYRDNRKQERKRLKRCFRVVGVAYVVYLVVSTLSQLAVAWTLEVPEGALGWNLWMMASMLAMYPLSTLFLYLIMWNGIIMTAQKKITRSDTGDGR